MHPIARLKTQAQQALHRLTQGILPEPEPVPLTAKAFQSLSDRYCLSHYLTYRYACNTHHGIWLADNPYGMDSYLIGFRLSPLIVAGDNTWEKLTSILNRLPVGTVLYSIAHANRDIAHYLADWAMARTHSNNPIFHTITQRRAAYLARWSREHQSVIQATHFIPRSIQYYWFIRIASPHTAVNPSALASFHQEVQQLSDWITAELKSSRMGVHRLSHKDLLRCLHMLCNPCVSPETLDETTLYDHLPLGPQLITPNVNLQIQANGDLYYENQDNQHKQQRYIRVLSATQFPSDPFYLAHMAACIGSVKHTADFIPGDFYAYTIMAIESPDKVSFRASKKMAMLQYQTASHHAFWQQIMRHLYQRKQHVQNLFDAIDKQGEVPVKMWTGMVLSAETRADVEAAMSSCQSNWKQVGFELYQETAISLPAWIATLPGQYRPAIDGAETGLQRGTTLAARHAALMMHVQGDWQGSHPKAGGLLVMSRRGVLTTLNLFDTFKSNYNAVMAATSGSGKSFLVNEMASDFLARGGMVRMIDAGRSYAHTADLLGGQNLVFERHNPLCINPFTALHTMDDLKEDMDILVTLITQMAFPSGYDSTGDNRPAQNPYEYRAIEEAIELIWQEKQSSMSVRDIADYFSACDEPALQRIARQLRPWAYGRYAQWMVGEAGMHFHNPLLILELDALSDEPELQAIVLNLVIARIAREMYLSTQAEMATYGHRRPKLIVIDEAWDLLKRPNTSDFIEKAYRRARKYLCAVMIVTQSFTDCDHTSAARTALENANWLFTLTHDTAALNKALDKKLITLSDYSLSMIKSLQKTDDYSEFYVINKSLHGEGLYRLIVDPETYWLYTTEGHERAKIAELVAQGKSLEEAITWVASLSSR